MADTPDTPIKCGNYVVALLDVLGQGDLLRSIRGGPITRESRDQLLAAAKQVVLLRQDFEKYFNEMPPAINKLREALGPQVDSRADSGSRITTRALSDTVVIAVSLIDSDSQATAVVDLWSTMFSACGSVLLSLARGYAIRGGIDLGLCVRVPDGEVYGAAVERAATLEKHHAASPRIVIGDELLTYLKAVRDQSPSSKLATTAIGAAKLCEALIVQDHDGRAMLDYLGSRVKESCPGVVEELSEDIRTFASRQRREFANDSKLGSRYEALWKYVEPRTRPGRA